MKNPTSVSIRMYKLGTGDCFTLKFWDKDEVIFKMMIDCGFWSRKKIEVLPYIEELKKDVESHVDVLVVTHEHKDHVKGFETARDLFVNDFRADRIWMGWTEDDENQNVKSWKKQYGQRKRALAIAAQYLKKEVRKKAFKNQFAGAKNGDAILSARQVFSSSLSDFAELHVDNISELSQPNETFAARPYIGGMKGMEIVKKEIPKGTISFFSQGELIENVAELSGVRFYTLGPPSLHKEIKVEHGTGDESYDHNKDLEETDLLLSALEDQTQESPSSCPFHSSYVENKSNNITKSYKSSRNAWRRIDQDWLWGSGRLALRMSSLTNNLSLALAIEIGENGKVLLFPGDAELGSWKSWHNINWDSKVPGLTTVDLLNRTVFYKVAHHISHNGTAQSLGLDHMTNPDLAAMATLDYSSISSRWMTTMPNRMIIKELLEKTKGRLMIMNPDGMFYDKQQKIPMTKAIKNARGNMSSAEKRTFKKSVSENEKLFIEYRIQL